MWVTCQCWTLLNICILLLLGAWEEGDLMSHAAKKNLILAKASQGKLSHRSGETNSTVEPLMNDHPHQRPSLSYDHISCDGQWLLFVYESLTSDHPSYTTTPMWFWGWSYKRGSTVFVCNKYRHWTILPVSETEWSMWSHWWNISVSQKDVDDLMTRKQLRVQEIPLPSKILDFIPLGRIPLSRVPLSRIL